MIILVYLLLSIILILLLTSKFKIHPAISLLIGSFFLGILLNMNFILILEYLLSKCFVIQQSGILFEFIKGIKNRLMIQLKKYLSQKN